MLPCFMSATTAGLNAGTEVSQLQLHIGEQQPNSEVRLPNYSHDCISAAPASMCKSFLSAHRIYIDGEAEKYGLLNVAVITADMNTFTTSVLYDRAVSIECFEHMKNYQKLLKHVSGWLKPCGLFFCHVFCHKTLAYHFEDNGDEDWMTRCVQSLPRVTCGSEYERESLEQAAHYLRHNTAAMLTPGIVAGIFSVVVQCHHSTCFYTSKTTWRWRTFRM